jgi:hypothetical protein
VPIIFLAVPTNLSASKIMGREKWQERKLARKGLLSLSLALCENAGCDGYPFLSSLALSF